MISINKPTQDFEESNSKSYQEPKVPDMCYGGIDYDEDMVWGQHKHPIS